MRSLLFASTLGAAHSLAVANKSKKPAVQALMESAKGMLKNGATTEVVAFAEETLAEVTGVVIPAIISESQNDQEFLDNLFARFTEIRAALEVGNTEIHQLNDEEQTLSAEHKACRDEEHTKCYGGDGTVGKRECEKEMYRLWGVWVAEEGHLREIHDDIHGHFCPPGSNGTTHEFRVTSAPWMQAYMDQKIVADAALLAYDQHVPLCVVEHASLNEESARCNVLMTNLEEKACDHASKIHEVATAFYGDFAQAAAAYQCAEEEVRQLQADRHQEWVTLQVVECLLEEIHNQNGVPCDTATEVDDRVVRCEELHQTEVCTAAPELCLNYELVPERPPFCANRDSVTGYCIAQLNPAPCCAGWEAQERAPLPEYPLPPFSHENPGCNALPACSGCPMLTMPVYESVDTCPGYTVDGCPRDGQDGEHPLTLIRSVNGLADVRCCQDDPTFSCKSQDFEGGVDFTTPNGGTHTQCYFDVTYQEALAVCHAAGMRICTHEEMGDNECCGTGCWHNHNAIWVDVQNPTALDRGNVDAGIGPHPLVYSVTHDQHVEQRARRDAEDTHREGIPEQ